MSEEKATNENSDVSRDEKNEVEDVERRPSLTESMGRRRSVAVNVVENPLKVSFAMLETWPRRTYAYRPLAR
jgi:hypothetical protein